MNNPSYDDVLDEAFQNPVVRFLCIDDEGLAEVLATALKDHPAPPPAIAPKITNIRQGNLTEFGVWDIGEKHWSLLDRNMTWTANADSPWKASSTDGVDILALITEGQQFLLIIEVKSSDGHGSNLVTGANSSLQSDFDRLFEGDVQNRLAGSVGKVLASLRYVHRRPDLEEQVKEMVGTRPEDCPSLRLLGVLVCKRGINRSAVARRRAFTRLKNHLVDAGWDASQCEFRTVEVNGLIALLDEVIEKVVS